MFYKQLRWLNTSIQYNYDEKTSSSEEISYFIRYKTNLIANVTIGSKIKIFRLEIIDHHHHLYEIKLFILYLFSDVKRSTLNPQLLPCYFIFFLLLKRAVNQQQSHLRKP